ncbi:CGNR zinc finger domain-containing protein [Nocardia brasiliensis]|uniref:CGNR zinc finger domain-containing protein n=1 Tax=Nocardia brasiliensis TaxID=37326 RepID=UPI0018948B22|nr:CGNR zinc finger domain-containing protein [Nocardia brasiliensis]MBF6126421.1 CGNR zinc finger domain-containing protein [Nocardia brasiliensis]
MHFNPYGGAAAELAARLVNAGPDQDLRQLLADADYKPLGSVTAAQVAELRRWVHELDAMFDHPTVRRLNALLAKTTSQPYISTHDERPPHLHFARETAPVDERVKAYTAVGLAALFCDDPTRMGRCAREGCDKVFVDTSRNGRRRFCSTRCSTRVHVAEHRSRRAG